MLQSIDDLTITSFVELAAKRGNPEFLHHYTTSNSLTSIVDGKSFWMSDRRTMNDHQESSYLRELCLKSYSEYSKPIERRLTSEGFDASQISVWRKTLQEYLSSFKLSYEGESKFVFILSFSEDDDVLSQWRAYGETVNGYVISLKFDSFRAMLDSDEHLEFALVPCIYELEDQQQIIKEFVSHVSQVFAEQGRENGFTNFSEPPELKKMADDFAFVCRFVKHPGFKEEAEWRLVAERKPGAKDLGAHPSGGGMIPHVELSFEPIADYMNVRFRVGPTDHSTMRQMAVFEYVSRRWTSGPEVRASEIPARI